MEALKIYPTHENGIAATVYGSGLSTKGLSCRNIRKGSSYKILLQVLEGGRLIDNKMKVVSFQIPLIVLTSSSGGQYYERGFLLIQKCQNTKDHFRIFFL